MGDQDKTGDGQIWRKNCWQVHLPSFSFDLNFTTLKRLTWRDFSFTRKDTLPVKSSFQGLL